MSTVCACLCVGRGGHTGSESPHVFQFGALSDLVQQGVSAGVGGDGTLLLLHLLQVGSLPDLAQQGILTPAQG